MRHSPLFFCCLGLFELLLFPSLQAECKQCRVKELEQISAQKEEAKEISGWDLGKTRWQEGEVKKP